MIYDVRHLTTVEYASEVRLARFNVRLKPADWPGQTVLDYALTADPLPWTMQAEDGPYLVTRHRLTLREPIMALTVESRFSIAVEPVGPPPEPAAGPTIAALRAIALARRDLSPTSPASYLYPSIVAGTAPEIAHWSRTCFTDDTPAIAAGTALMNAIYHQFTYDSDSTESDTPPAVAFAQRSGVCQDFAHIMIIAARMHGIPAAYISGYLRTLPPPGKPRLVGADAMHAWVALWCGEELGWIGFDPTNNVYARADHIFIAMGRDYVDIAPLDGVFLGGRGQKLDVSVDVAPREMAAI